MIRIALPVLFLVAGAADWPQYRGPNRDDVSKEIGLLKEWPKGGPPLAWTFEAAGVGYSPPSVVGDRVYVTGGRDDDELLIAIDAKTGKEAWTAKIGPTFRWKGNSWSAGPSAAPTVAGDRVLALGGNGDLLCASTAGKELWRVNLPKDLDGQVNPIGGGPRNLGWGFTAAPIVDGDRVVVACGGPKGTLAALDLANGQPVWRSADLKDQAAYTSPMPATLGGVKQYVVLTNPGLAGIAATDGKLLWSHRRKAPYGTEVINSPIVKDGKIYVTVAASNGGCELVSVAKDGTEWKVSVEYSLKSPANHHGNMVLVDGKLFGCGPQWTCQDFATGAVLWSERKLGTGAVTFADGRLYCYAEADGTTALVDADPKGWTERGRMKPPKASKLRQPQGKVWAPPVVANGRLYLRDQELLFAYDVTAK